MGPLAARLFLWKTERIAGPRTHRLYRARFTWQARHATFTEPRTELCLEGFPRSANSYAYNAFAAANPKVRRYARHVHTISQIAEAVRLDVPALLVIRPPAPTVASFLGRFSPAAAASVLRAYSAYYRGVLPFADRVVVSGFDVTTRDLGRAIDAVNQRYGTGFLILSEASRTAAIVRLKTHVAERRGVEGLPPIPEDGRGDREIPALPSALLAEAEAAYAAVARHALT